MNASGIVPVDVKVLVKPDVVEEKTAGGILLPDATKEQQKFATVRATLVAVGRSAFGEWLDRPKTGVRVVIAQYAGANIKGDDGEMYRICNDEDVISILEPAE